MAGGSSELWQGAAVALALGLLVGAEREKGNRSGSGVRTYALVALAGYLATLLPDPLGVALVAGIALLVLAGYHAVRTVDPGITSEVALLLTLALGALAGSHAALAVGAAVAMVVLLASKESLHAFLRESVTERERADALTFFVAAFIVLPLLPSDGFGPGGVLSPHRVWLLVVLITGVGWAGYAATRTFGSRRGLLIAGLAGGFVSATATIGTLAGRCRRREATAADALAGGLMASVATLVEIVLLTSAVDRDVALMLLPACVGGAAVLAAEAWWLSRTRPGRPDEEEHHGRPFALRPALLLAGVISVVVLLAAWMEDRYGSAGATLVAATGGLADVHATAVALAGLAHDRQLGVSAAVTAVALGLGTNTCSKVVAATVAGGRAFGLRVLVLHLPVAVVVGALVLASR